MPSVQIQINFCGAFYRDKAKQYILVVIDHFTHWVEAYCTARNDAKTVEVLLPTKYLQSLGVCCTTDSNQGPHFVSKGV